MPKERNKADGYREKAYEGDTKAMNNLGVCYERGTGVKVSLEPLRVYRTKRNQSSLVPFRVISGFRFV